MENKQLTRRVAFLEKIEKNQQDFDGFTKEIDRMNALFGYAEIQKLMKKDDQKENWQDKSAKMKGHIKSLEKKLKKTNDFRSEITEEMEALLEEDVNPNQTMCIKMARQTSEYHEELRREVRSNFEHMRKANSGLQKKVMRCRVSFVSLYWLEASFFAEGEKENMEFEHERRGIAIQEYTIKLKAADQRIQELEEAIILKEQNEIQMQYENSELCKKFWDQTTQVETLIKMLEDKTARIV
ncbi:hypothetical protein B9Z55_026088 [Caenorhabditis nigoni]|nr:hypothetical protein B9Z55_026088 [Caenorhabditis nigoni]